MDALKPMTYKEWLAANPDLEKQEEECFACNGTGEDECPHCGNDMECEECGGTGKINSARAIYEAQLLEDKKRLERARLVGMVCVRKLAPAGGEARP